MAFTSCRVTHIPEAYNFRISEVQKNPYGCWTEFVFYPQKDITLKDTVAGELLTMNNDSAIILVDDGVIKVLQCHSINSGKLFTHKNQGGTYFWYSALMMAPSVIGALSFSEYSFDFLSLGIPIALFGTIITLRESRFERSRLAFPEKNSLAEFKVYARFPGGMPANIDFSQLKLKKLPLVQTH